MKSRDLSGVHLISECALDKHVWRTPDVDHLGNTSRLRFSNSYISTDKQPAVWRAAGCPEKKREMGNLLSETRANLRNSLIRVPFSRARRGRAYRAGEGLNRFVTDPLISHMRGSSQCKTDESESDFASWEIRRGSEGM
ncbi:hypothetical protein ALC62_06815 [Cyphomyrmex costatus]|uniref:Uncharacterized protein n=1 Tax=Cyphomyrmex costatus TaxID=456900 RepID=A0A195CP66_9HYME|nr:hypothetical protein ALC62_06815 [Cyphomyrmex costatus]